MKTFNWPLTLKEPECPLGYPWAQLARQLSEGEYLELQRQMIGQTVGTCNGLVYNPATREYEKTPCRNHPHGSVAYTNDVRKAFTGG